MTANLRSCGEGHGIEGIQEALPRLTSALAEKTLKTCGLCNDIEAYLRARGEAIWVGYRAAREIG